MLPQPKTSFTRKSKTNVISIPGVISIPSNNQLVVSTGVSSIDRILNGVPVGSMLLIEEDVHRSFSNKLLRCAISEGVTCGHESLIITDLNSRSLSIDLPSPMENSSSKSKRNDMELKIAWRYSEKQHKNYEDCGHFSRDYDFSKPLSKEKLESSFVSALTLGNDTLRLSNEEACSYQKVLNVVKEKICDKYLNVESNRPSNVLRIVIDGLGSPLWTTKATHSEVAVCQFLFMLKSLLRSSFTVAFVTVPSYFYERLYVERFRRMADAVIGFKSFAGSSKKPNPAYKDYQGLFHVEKLAKLNSLGMSGNELFSDLAIKATKRHFSVERLHLPPLFVDDAAKDVGCSSQRSKFEDF